MIQTLIRYLRSKFHPFVHILYRRDRWRVRLMKFSIGQFRLPLITVLLLCSGIAFAQNPPVEPVVIPVAFYNLENLFDTIDQENEDEEYLPDGANQWTMEKYTEKLYNMARVISGIGGNGPSIIGVAEIENRGVLEDLVAQESLRHLGYKIVHYDSPDKRGVDCGILYQPDVFQVFSSGHRAVNIPGEPDVLTRDIVYASGRIDGEIVHILVGHWPSRSGGEQRSMPRRMAAARTMKSVADSLYHLFPGSKVIMMGDFNDDPTSPSVRDGLQVKKSVKQTAPADYYTPMLPLYNKGMGTLAYRDVWNLFDIMVVNGELLGRDVSTLQLYEDPGSGDLAFIYKQPFMLQQQGQYRDYSRRTSIGGQYQGGYSDHFPVFLFLIKAKPATSR